MNRIFFLTGTVILFLLAAPLQADMRITGLNPINLGTYSGTGLFRGNDNLCVYDSDNSIYGVTITAGGSFTATSGAETASYTTRWNDSTGTSGNVNASHGSKLTNRGNANTSSETCGGGTNANIEIVFSESTMQSSTPGTYSDNITIVVSPN